MTASEILLVREVKNAMRISFRRILPLSHANPCKLTYLA